MKTNIDQLEVNGVVYVRADSVPVNEPKPNGNRFIVVVDRGWIFAGDLVEENGRIKLSRAIHVFGWEHGGFALLSKDLKKAKADLRPCDDVDIPIDSEIFRQQVSDYWGV